MEDIKIKIKREIENEIKKSPDQISIVFILNGLIRYAYEMRASDIHLEPFQDKLKIRFRIDGVMHTMFEFPKDIQDEILTRIKILSNLRIDEHLIPQDGRFKYVVEEGEKEFDVRVSIMPTYYGENAVMRLLVESQQVFSLENLGFSRRDLYVITKAIRKPYGMILVTGPTGSGKTTTLYTILKILNNESITIITLEDPIEYSIEGVTQIQVNIQAGLTFDSGLRTILRQDPDIIMVGEIRDRETAKISVNAALTGHLLLSTLHTNDSATVFPRLLEMEIEPFLIASTVNVVIAQRLVRTICQNCKKEKELSDVEINALVGLVPEKIINELREKRTVYIGKGCPTCNNSGYWGRIGIFEVLLVSPNVKKLIMLQRSSDEIKRTAQEEGMATMIEDGFQKVLAGLTTIEEVLRVIHD
ncbi:MAG: GspE/PulE family protein [Patescibacteria group bacterium]|nr:GspE/PulE family protein [Patescibacteria group bacterium]